MQDMQQQQQQQHESENEDISADFVDVTTPPAASSIRAAPPAEIRDQTIGTKAAQSAQDDEDALSDISQEELTTTSAAQGHDEDLSDVSMEDLLSEDESAAARVPEEATTAAKAVGASAPSKSRDTSVPSVGVDLAPAATAASSSIMVAPPTGSSESARKRHYSSGSSGQLSGSGRDAWLSAFGVDQSTRNTAAHTGPQLIDALAQPYRRAFQRGISANTVGRLSAPNAKASGTEGAVGGSCSSSGAVRNGSQTDRQSVSHRLIIYQLKILFAKDGFSFFLPPF